MWVPWDLNFYVDDAGIQFPGTDFDRHSLMEPDFEELNFLMMEREFWMAELEL